MKKLMAEVSEKPRAGRLLMECSGACGDLGTFIPHVIGAMTVAGLAPAGVLFGFAAFLIGTGLFYGLPASAADEGDFRRDPDGRTSTG